MQSEFSANNYSGHGINRAFYLPRLQREFYQGDATIHWTISIAQRAIGWLDEIFHSRFREIMLHTAIRENLFCPVYCLMPDHIHLVWMGMSSDSDQKNATKFLHEHLASGLRPHRFQHQAYDHVLREEERKRTAFTRICFYILANPVRASLIKESESWPYCGAVIPSYPKLHPSEEDFWPLFWKLYQKHRQPDAGKRRLPRVRSSERQLAQTFPLK